MSRRFGRKQRRACIATIEALCAAVDDLSSKQELLSTLNGKKRAELEAQRDFLLGRIKYWDHEIRGLLGPYTSFAIDDTTFRVDRPDQIRQMAVMPAAPSFLFAGPEAMPSIEYYVETMLGFIAGFHDADLARLRRNLTLRVTIGEDSSGMPAAYYAFSESMWNELKRAGPDAMQRMAHRVAGDLVRLMAAPPKEKKRA